VSPSPIERYWDAVLEGEEPGPDALLESGGEEARGALKLRRLLAEAGERWREPRTPRQLGRFQVVGSLGAGGLGRVWLAWDPELRRRVAIKVIERDRWAVNEARSIARLDHRAVVKVFEVGPDRLVMEVLDGGSLQDVIEGLREKEEGFLAPIRERLHCLVRIAEGLAYCHERGVLHRDVKPGNVLFAESDPYPRLIDFGLAHVPGESSLDITQVLIGSPAYVAPEQVENGETGTDPRSDQFSFGVLAYELLTPENPFARETRTKTLDAVREGRAPSFRRFPPEVPEPVRRIVLHCLEHDPDHRYESMKQVVLDLQNALADRPISIGRRGVGRDLALWYRRNRQVAWVGIAGVAVAAIGAIGLWAASTHASRARILEAASLRDSDVSAAKSLTDLTRSGIGLLTLQERAGDFDEGAIRRHLFGETRDSVTSVSRRWSRLLHDFAKQMEDESPDGASGESFANLFYLDQSLLSDAPWNEEFRGRGQVVLPDELRNDPAIRMLIQDLLAPTGLESGYRVFREIPWIDYPRPGYYRLEIPGVWQREFVVLATFEPARRIERHDWRFPADELQRVPGLPGRLFSRPVTIAQAAAYAATIGMELPEADVRSGDFPVRRDWSFANGFAAWAGGRLPEGEEIWVLRDDETMGKDLRIAGEWVSDIFSPAVLNYSGAVEYGKLDDAKADPGADDKRPTIFWLSYVEDRGTGFDIEEGTYGGGVGFRIVLPTPE